LTLKHDQKKPVPACFGVDTGFPKRSCLDNELKRNAESAKNHLALATFAALQRLERAQRQLVNAWDTLALVALVLQSYLATVVVDLQSWQMQNGPI